ncbi:hypothetical protein K2173_011299 [Erythroxylum novogranatense]|uniref:Uncharacterized protein n=1 Tax=Erythroxylum novogranatense TaxID=1862640 RepID=A0AAV8S9M0_9ROSI|nr:hypothetical protein K2173_011299 [Erythroxylum novogranatense]
MTVSGGDGRRKRCIREFVDRGSVESYRYYVSRKNVFEMLNFSGYYEPDSEMEVIFLGTGKVNQSAIPGLYTRITNKETVEGLILILRKMTYFAREQLLKFPFKVHIFHITELPMNLAIGGHNYDILTLEDKHELLKKYNLEAKQGQVVNVAYNEGIADSHVDVSLRNRDKTNYYLL